MQPTTAIILAAGGSTRMGRPKQLLKLGDRTLLNRTVDTALAAGCDRVIVVLGAAADLIEPTVDRREAVVICHNRVWHDGIGTSIRAGLRTARALHPPAERIFLMLADQPTVDADVLRQLDAEQSRTGRPACVSAFGGTLGPPVLVTQILFDDMRTLPDDAGAKMLWQHDPQLISHVDCPAAAVDVDTPEEFARVAGPLNDSDGE